MSNTSSTNSGSKVPKGISFEVHEREDQKGFWTRIGSVWASGDGPGVDIRIETVGINGLISLLNTFKAKG